MDCTFVCDRKSTHTLFLQIQKKWFSECYTVTYCLTFTFILIPAISDLHKMEYISRSVFVKAELASTLRNTQLAGFGRVF